MKKASNCKYECRRWLPFPPPSSFHPIVGSHAAWLPGSGCSLANMPTSLWFSTAAPANHEPRPCCLSVLYFPIHECDARGDICILLPLLTLSASTYVLVYIYIYKTMKLETTWNVMVRGAVAYDYLHASHVSLSWHWVHPLQEYDQCLFL